jgi:hypothetical protein
MSAPAFIGSAIASGEGKTTATAAIARRFELPVLAVIDVRARATIHVDPEAWQSIAAAQCARAAASEPNRSPPGGTPSAGILPGEEP